MKKGFTPWSMQALNLTYRNTYQGQKSQLQILTCLKYMIDVTESSQTP